MPKQIDVATYACDCGHISYFCENTIWEMEALSRKQRKEVRLGSSEKPTHGIVFEHGAAIGIACPREPGVVRRFYPDTVQQSGAAAHKDAGARGLKRRQNAARPAFTPRQGQYLAFVHLYTKLNRRPPAEADVAAYFRLAPPAVHQMIVSLTRKRLVERTPGVPRSIRVLVPSSDLPELTDVDDEQPRLG